MALMLLDTWTPTCFQCDMHILTIKRSRGVPKIFGVITPLFSRSGQHRADHEIDPMVRGDPEYPHIYGSRYFVTVKMIGV
jgi:hypothetical protein